MRDLKPEEIDLINRIFAEAETVEDAVEVFIKSLAESSTKTTQEQE